MKIIIRFFFLAPNAHINKFILPQGGKQDPIGHNSALTVNTFIKSRGVLVLKKQILTPLMLCIVRCIFCIFLCIYVIIFAPLRHSQLLCFKLSAALSITLKERLHLPSFGSPPFIYGTSLFKGYHKESFNPKSRIIFYTVMTLKLLPETIFISRLLTWLLKYVHLT